MTHTPVSSLKRAAVHSVDTASCPRWFGRKGAVCHPVLHYYSSIQPLTFSFLLHFFTISVNHGCSCAESTWGGLEHIRHCTTVAKQGNAVHQAHPARACLGMYHFFSRLPFCLSFFSSSLFSPFLLLLHPSLLTYSLLHHDHKHRCVRTRTLVRSSTQRRRWLCKSQYTVFLNEGFVAPPSQTPLRL